MAGYDDVVVRGPGLVKEFDDGVRVEDGTAGVELRDSSHYLVEGTDFTAPDIDGIEVRTSSGSSTGNRLRFNTVGGGEGDRIVVTATATDPVLRANTTTDNSDDGIDVESSSTTLRDNVANDNGDLGIEAVAGVTDGGGNRASGNGNPAQCTGVACTLSLIPARSGGLSRRGRRARRPGRSASG